ncbi:MAG: single-stranded DNA-binding protein [Herbiconiux sp.]|uniref:single-stranded DNA-binding protein n=1 Tax=Herbiconiux sp. TaxID=1871186 RepID=UPI0012145902|nr:single-stranded DNA-binding protein [Herbiconiux sp.]TAJ47195.1 MAG: single-stranded DNA-binding protein [Herbiconiux sp.]
MPDLMSLTGIVATPPRHITTNSGLEITSFRLASGQRRFDREQRKWVDADTNWYTVTAFRHLAVNIAGSLERGQHVVVTGRLRVRSWESGEKSGITVEVEADAIGHDLSWGTSVYTRSSLPATGGAPGSEGAQAADAVDAPADGGWAAPGVVPGGAVETSSPVSPFSPPEASEPDEGQPADGLQDVLVPF